MKKKTFITIALSIAFILLAYIIFNLYSYFAIKSNKKDEKIDTTTTNAFSEDEETTKENKTESKVVTETTENITDTSSSPTETDGESSEEEIETTKSTETTKKDKKTTETTKSAETTKKDKTTTETTKATETSDNEDLAELKEWVNLSNGFALNQFGVTPEILPDKYSVKITPVSGEHPRVLLNTENVAIVKSNLKNADNKAAYNQYFGYSNTYNLKTAAKNGTLNLNDLARIEALALKHALTGEKIPAYKAIYAIKNTILDVNCSADVDPYRGYGAVMFVAAEVYDWCYDVLSDIDKQQILNGVINNLAKKFEIGYPPAKEGEIGHHNLECQLLKSYLSFAIAVYDEFPSLYNYVAGRLITDFVPSQNYFLKSGIHWEGSGYGAFRGVYLMYGQYLMSAMTHGTYELFDKENLHRTMQTFIDFYYPGEIKNTSMLGTYEIGDQCNESTIGLKFAAFYAGNYFSDANLLALSNLSINSKTDFTSISTYDWVTPSIYLILNNFKAKTLTDPNKGRSLVNIISYPKSTIFAKTGNTKNDVGVYMTMNEDYTVSHSNPDCGSFQIYFKGCLATESGVYDGYGSNHHKAYSAQTISKNSLLIKKYNAKDMGYDNRVYSGGQSIKNWPRICCPSSIEEFEESENHNQATIFGKTAKGDANSYEYSYLAGDMTKAYDSSAVSEVTRHMLSIATGNSLNPLVFVTFDRIESGLMATKTWLFHSHYLPTIVKDGTFYVYNGNATLVTQSLFNSMTATIYGDDESCYTVNGTAYNPSTQNIRGKDYRLELSPKSKSITDYFLEVMYVEDGRITSVAEATEIKSSSFIGAEIFDTVTMFAKKTNSFSGNDSFKIQGDGEKKVFICGVSSGTWTVECNGTTIGTYTVKEGTSLLTFTTPCGTISFHK